MKLGSSALVYQPRKTTPTGIIMARAAARADDSGRPVIIKVADAIGEGYFSAVKPGESAERRASQANTIEAMRHDEWSEDNCIVVYCSKGASSHERVHFAVKLAQRSKMAVVIQGTHRRGRTYRVVVMPRGEPERKIRELIQARR